MREALLAKANAAAALQRPFALTRPAVEVDIDPANVDLAFWACIFLLAVAAHGASDEIIPDGELLHRAEPSLNSGLALNAQCAAMRA